MPHDFMNYWIEPGAVSASTCTTYASCCDMKRPMNVCTIGCVSCTRIALVPRPLRTCVQVDAKHTKNENAGGELVLEVPQAQKEPPNTNNSASTPTAHVQQKGQVKAPKAALKISTTLQPVSRPKVGWMDLSSSPYTSSGTGRKESMVINDMCSSLARHDPTAECLGLLKGDEDSYLLHHKQINRNELENTVSLEALLKGST